jgi:uncharacterized protein (TIGR03086 family)
MDAKDLFYEAVTEASGCVVRIEPDQLGNSTPCSEWDLKALVGHMVYELAWVPDLLAGKTVAEVGDKYEGDLLGKDAAEAWVKYLKTAQEAVAKAHVETAVHLSYGDVKADRYIREVGGDIIIHGWDVGQAINCSVVFNKKLAQAVFDYISPLEKDYRPTGLIGEHLPTDGSDSLQAKLLAFFGRKEDWQPVSA